MFKSLCPHCAREGFRSEVEILKIMELGVSYKCPEHGNCGSTYDHLDPVEMFNLLPMGNLTPSRY